MAKADETKKNYRIERIDETTEPPKTQAEPERLEVDPLENLPDLSAQTGGLPIVTFILICLSAGIVMIANMALHSGSILVMLGCLVLDGIAVFGIVALVRGMFTRLRRQAAQPWQYWMSTAVMAVGILGGLIIGIFDWL